MAFLPFNSINTAEGTLQPVTNQQDNKGITNLRKRMLSELVIVWRGGFCAKTMRRGRFLKQRKED